MAEVRCLFVVTHYLPLVGGAQAVYDALCQQFPEQFQVLTSPFDHSTGLEADGWSEFDASAPYKITRVDRTRPDLADGAIGLWGRVKGQLAFRSLQRKLVNSIVAHCEQQNINVICIGAGDGFSWLPKALKKKTSIPLVYYTHGEEFSQEAHSPRAEEARRSAIANSDGVICVSSFTQELLKQKYGATDHQLCLINNGVDFDRYATRLGKATPYSNKSPSEKWVVATGRMVARKGFDKLVEAWPQVIAAQPGAKLLLAGKGPLFDPLGDSITKLGLEDSVQQLGFVPDDELIALLQSADLFTMPNRTMPDGDTEGFGLVFLEAAAAGATSVGGRAGGATDAIRHGETGLLVNGENADDIAEAITSLLGDDVLRQKMAEAAHEHAKASDWNTKARQFVEFVGTLT